MISVQTTDQLCMNNHSKTVTSLAKPQRDVKRNIYYNNPSTYLFIFSAPPQNKLTEDARVKQFHIKTSNTVVDGKWNQLFVMSALFYSKLIEDSRIKQFHLKSRNTAPLFVESKTTCLFYTNTLFPARFAFADITQILVCLIISNLSFTECNLRR